MLVLYFGLAYGYHAYLASSVTKLDQNIAQFGEQIPQADQDKTAQFYSQLVNLRELLKSHTVASPLFAVLERTALPNVYYSKLNANTSTNEVDITGAAKSLEDAAAEVALLEQQPEVARVHIVNAGSQNNAWQFTMNVFFAPDILHANGAAGAAAIHVPPAPPVTAPASTSSQATSSTP